MIIRLALALAFAGSAVAQPIEFKGVQLGATAAEARAAFPLLECLELGCTVSGEHVTSRACRLGDTACYSEVTKAMLFGPAYPDQYRVTLDAGRVASVDISFPQTHFSDVVAALAVKYGPPTTDRREPVQNRMGAVFDDRTVTWRRPDGVIQASERFARVSTSNVYMATKAHYEKRLADAKAQPQTDAKRL